jgi:hypothetical protein
VNSIEYERYQLETIALEYERLHYQVEIAGRLADLPFEFDAVATKGDETVIIELVNRRMNEDAMQRKLLALETVARRIPGARVDFRYIDVDAGAVWLARRRTQAKADQTLKETLAVRLPQFAAEKPNAAGRFLQVWLNHVATLRAYGAKRGLQDVGNENVLDLYNELLKIDALNPPEVVDDGLEQDLFELYAGVRGVILGGPIDSHSFAQLRGHVLHVRAQIRRHIKAKA